MEAPYLGEDAVVLRALHDDDVDALVELARDRLFARWVDVPASLDGADDRAGERAAAAAFVVQAQDGWAQESRFTLAVELEGRWAGTVVLHPDDAGAARVGCALSPWARGRGAASAAVRLALTWAFVEQGAALVHWRAEVGNWPARRVAWACGMTTDGAVRGLLVRHDERVDAWVGSVRWDEPLGPRSPWLAPVALTGRTGVHLDALVADDVARVAQACSAASVQAWLPELPSPYTVADAIAFVATREEEHATGRGVYWAVRDRPGGPLTGTVGLFRLAPGSHSAEVGYWVHPDAAGRGVATSAVRAVALHALAPAADGGLGLSRLVLRAARGNLASRRVAGKAGFAAVGVERGAERLRDGTVTDLLVHDAVAGRVREGG